MKNIWLAKSNGVHLQMSEGAEFTFNQDVAQNVDKVYRIERVIPKRSLSQNNFFWKYLEIIETSTGNDTKAMHDYVVKYLTPKKEVSINLVDKNGKIYVRKGMAGKGTSELTKLEMSDVLDKLAMDTGVPIPDVRELENFITNY